MLWLLAALVPLFWLAMRWARKGGRTAWPGLKTPAGAPITARGWLRSLPIALALTAGVLWCLAAARPASVITLPSPHETVILA
ncbi:MAG: ABC transporter ATP-binding protein, partial [Burkholderiales bacterium]|nr:ABC transporter ATP-binding protein [Burkholderiales bacterium]